MSRLLVLLSFAALCLFASCVNLKAPARVSQCERDNNCADSTGGKGGATAGSGGSTSHSGDAGASDGPAGGRGGSGGTGGSGGQVSGGSTTDSGSTGGSGGKGGTGGEATGGTADAGTEPTPDAPIDKPVGSFDLPVDTNTKPESSPDTIKTGPEVGPPEPSPDVSPDISPDRPDTAFDSSTCIQSFKSNGYSLSSSSDGGINACSECKTSGGNSLETPCKGMVDCLVTAWVCNSRTAGCWTNCRNGTPGADMVADDCVAALVGKACP